MRCCGSVGLGLAFRVGLWVDPLSSRRMALTHPTENWSALYRYLAAARPNRWVNLDALPAVRTSQKRAWRASWDNRIRAPLNSQHVAHWRAPAATSDLPHLGACSVCRTGSSPQKQVEATHWLRATKRLDAGFKSRLAPPCWYWRSWADKRSAKIPARETPASAGIAPRAGHDERGINRQRNS